MLALDALLEVVGGIMARHTVVVEREAGREHRKYADLVIDTVGGVTQTASFDILVPGGRLISSVSQPDEALARDLMFSDQLDESLKIFQQLAEADGFRLEVGKIRGKMLNSSFKGLKV